MKISELLTESMHALRVRVAERLVRELGEMAQVFRDNLAELEGISHEEMPIPFTVINARDTDKHNVLPLVVVTRNTNVSDSVWEAVGEHIADFLKDEGYVNGMLPVDVIMTRSGTSLYNLEVT